MLKDRLLEGNLNTLNCCCTDVNLLQIIRNPTKIGISFHEQKTLDNTVLWSKNNNPVDDMRRICSSTDYNCSFCNTWSS